VEGKEVEGLIYSFELWGRLLRIRLRWEEGGRLYVPVQKHTSRVIELLTFPSPPLIGDGVITRLRGVEIGVKTADCAPVVAIGRECVGVAHVGWRGLSAGILENFINRLALHENPGEMFLFVGPCARSCCYEVGQDLRVLFPRDVEFREGKLFLDLQEAVIKRLLSLGVKRVGSYGFCTVCSEKFPSYRRERTKERMLTSVMIL